MWKLRLRERKPLAQGLGVRVWDWSCGLTPRLGPLQWTGWPVGKAFQIVTGKEGDFGYWGPPGGLWWPNAPWPMSPDGGAHGPFLCQAPGG